jgi:hypothetical protein
MRRGTEESDARRLSQGSYVEKRQPRRRTLSTIKAMLFVQFGNRGGCPTIR